MGAKKNLLWKMATAERLQTWPAESRISYFSKPTKFMPKHFVNKGNIRTPADFGFDVPARYGIAAAAFATHKKGYYIMRRETETSEIIYVLRGVYKARIADGNFDIRRGQFLFLPVNETCRDSIEGKSADILWFRMEANSHWKKISGGKPILGQSENLAKIVSLSKMYIDEAYAAAPSREHLDDIMKIIAETLRREFLKTAGLPERENAENILEHIRENIAKSWTLAKAAKKFGLSRKELNSLFEKHFGGTFAKTVRKSKMDIAVKLLSKGKTMRSIAKKTGFADAYSFSNAFKSHFGTSPKSFRKTMSGGKI